MNSVDIKIDETLASIDKIKRVDAPYFFETRLLARMQNELVTTKNNWWHIKQPIFVTASLILLLCLNVYLVEFKNERLPTASTSPKNTSITIENFANEYQLNSNFSNY